MCMTPSGGWMFITGWAAGGEFRWSAPTTAACLPSGAAADTSSAAIITTATISAGALTTTMAMNTTVSTAAMGIAGCI